MNIGNKPSTDDYTTHLANTPEMKGRTAQGVLGVPPATGNTIYLDQLELLPGHGVVCKLI